MTSIRSLGTYIALAVLLNPVAHAIESNTLYMCDDNSMLYTLTAANAEASAGIPMVLEGGMPIPRCTGLAFFFGFLFAATREQLFYVDAETGAAFSKPFPYGAGINDINSLVVQPGTFRIFGAGAKPPGRFFRIFPLGDAHELQSFGPELGSAGGLAFLEGTLYATVNHTDFPDRTFLAVISQSDGTEGQVTDLKAIYRIEDDQTIFLRGISGLEERNRKLFGVMRTGELLTINPNTGLATLRGDNDKVQSGLANSPP